MVVIVIFLIPTTFIIPTSECGELVKVMLNFFVL